MQSRKNLNWLIALLAAMVLGLAACSGGASGGSDGASSGESGGTASSGGKALVVYFSRTKGHENGDLEVGNTKRVATFIKDYVKGDEFEIVPESDYPDSYDDTVAAAKKELEEDARPAIKGKVPDLSGYDTVFVGAPVWLEEYPKIVETFLDGADLKGKTIVPFVTHEGSEMGNIQTFMETKYKGEKVLKGLAVVGHESEQSKDKVEAWLKELGL